MWEVLHAQTMDLGTSHSCKEQGDLSGDSTCTGESKFGNESEPPISWSACSREE